MSGGGLSIAWEPPGPVSQRFMQSRMPVQILNGPIGSGKTTTALMKGLRLASEQWPSRLHKARNQHGELVPVRQFRLCVVRDTYRQLWRSTLKSWFERVPREVGDFTGAENAPAAHRITFGLSDGTVVDFQVDFVAIGENSAEEVLRGYEPTAFYLNEADTLSEDVFTYAAGRTGRYPSVADCGSRWHGVYMDCNAPELNNWLYRAFFKRSPEDLRADDTELFRMPGARSPGAENLKNLTPGYYEGQARINRTKTWYIARMIDNIPGFSRDGKPVYLQEFNDALHVRDGLDFITGIKLQLGLDAGLNPACLAGQRMPNGQWRILREFVGETGTGAVRFGEGLARWLRETFPEARDIEGWADPSAAYGADKKAGEKSWIEIVAAKTGVRIRPAPTNKLIPRLDAMRMPLNRLVDGEPGLLLDSRCVVMREGFNATYRYKKAKPNEDVYHDEPEKNDASHIHDAGQYLVSGGGEHQAVYERVEDRHRTQRMPQHVNDWNPFDPGAAL